MLSWSDVCQWVLGRPAPLWPLLFEQPLLERAKELVGRDFSAVVDEVTGLLGAALQVRGTAGVLGWFACLPLDAANFAHSELTLQLQLTRMVGHGFLC